MMDVEDCLILWWMKDVVWLPILLYFRCHIGAYHFFVKISSLTLVFTLFHDDGCWFWLFDFFMIFSGVTSRVINWDRLTLLDILAIFNGITLVRYASIQAFSGSVQLHYHIPWWSSISSHWDELTLFYILTFFMELPWWDMLSSIHTID